MTGRAWLDVRRPRVAGTRCVGAAMLVLVFAATPRPSHAQRPDTTRVGGAVVDTTRVDEPAVDTTGVGEAVADPPTSGSSGLAQTPLSPEVAAHLDHLAVSFTDTPDGMGLIATALAEAETAADGVRRAGRDSTDLGAMRRAVGDVLHAIDPSEVGSGAGSGYGFKRAAREVLRHIELAESSPGATESVHFHAPHVRRAARGALRQADQAIELARRIQRATEAASAHRLLEELAERVRAMTYGEDRDGDGRIGYVEEESGLAQAEYHLNLIRRVEGLAANPDPR